jgi:hypothetical protein
MKEEALRPLQMDPIIRCEGNSFSRTGRHIYFGFINGPRFESILHINCWNFFGRSNFRHDIELMIAPDSEVDGLHETIMNGFPMLDRLFMRAAVLPNERHQSL